MADKKRKVTAPDGSKVSTKYDNQGRERKIVTKTSDGQRMVDRFNITERQAMTQAKNPTFREEDSPISGYRNGGVFKEAAMADKKRRTTPRGY